MTKPVLKLENYAVSFDTPLGEVEAVRGVDLTLNKGEILCLVGESGCGKTALCQSIMKLLPPYSRIKSGKVILDGKDITHFNQKKMRLIRGKRMGMIFQDPMLSLNPTIPIGKQITEAILRSDKVSRSEAKERAIELLKVVGIEDAEVRFNLQPHFFSGGMRQRLVIAIVLAMSPEIIFADEPTTMLDVTVEAKILRLIKELRDSMGISIVFISHDLGTVAGIADRVAIMYAGKIVETGTADEIFYEPGHPYTRGLLSCLPAFAIKTGELKPIPGMPPRFINPPR